VLTWFCSRNTGFKKLADVALEEARLKSGLEEKIDPSTLDNLKRGAKLPFLTLSKQGSPSDNLREKAY
jgi:hypothetical protein